MRQTDDSTRPGRLAAEKLLGFRHIKASGDKTERAFEADERFTKRLETPGQRKSK